MNISKISARRSQKARFLLSRVLREPFYFSPFRPQIWCSNSIWAGLTKVWQKKYLRGIVGSFSIVHNGG
jgi:hypothetical protein